VTADKNELLSKLERIDVEGGGDCPEMVMEGIKRALEKALHKSEIFVFTDAPAKDGYLKNKIIRLIQEKQVTITFIITLGCEKPLGGFPLYNRLAQISGGQVYDINESEITTLMKFITKTLNIHRELVYVEDFMRDMKDTFVVTENISDIIVTVTGAIQRINLTNPDSQIVQLEPIVNLETVRIYQIISPKPGSWMIDTRVSNTGRLKITQVGQSNFDFGFSVTPPKSIEETFVPPQKGIKNHLVAKPHNFPNDYNFTHVTIISDHTTNRYDLSEVVPGLLITDKFEPPEQFKVTIHGTDDMGNEIKRLISTSVQPDMECK
jgi:hypothetical protein